MPGYATQQNAPNVYKNNYFLGDKKQKIFTFNIITNIYGKINS